MTDDAESDAESWLQDLLTYQSSDGMQRSINPNETIVTGQQVVEAVAQQVVEAEKPDDKMEAVAEKTADKKRPPTDSTGQTEAKEARRWRVRPEHYLCPEGSDPPLPPPREVPQKAEKAVGDIAAKAEEEAASKQPAKAKANKNKWIRLELL